MAVAIHIRGETCEMTVRLERWLRPAATGWDADWIVGTVELTAGGFYGARAVNVLAGHLVDFRAELAAVLESLTGEASLRDVESEFGARIVLDFGTGELDVFVQDPVGAQLSVDGVRTDQSYLSATLDELTSAIDEFGARGNLSR